MAAHRYWRAVNLEAYGEGDLEISCFHLLAAGVRVDDTATLTSNIAPATGTLATIQDDDPTTFARWPAASVQSIALQWDFGAGGKDLNDIQLAGGSERRFPLLCKLQWSDDAATWTDYFTFSGIKYPGVGVKTFSAVIESGGGAGDPDFEKVIILLHGDSPAGTSTIANSATTPLAVASFGVTTTASPVKFGSGALAFNGSSRLSIDATAAIDLPGDFTIEAWIRPESSAAYPVIVGRQEPTTGLVLQFRVNAGSLETVVRAVGGSGLQVMSGGSVGLGVWHHVALSRTAGSMTQFLNGNPTGNITSTIDFTHASRPLTAGALDDTTLSGYFTGTMDDIRITKGLGRYTSAFTPPTEPFPNSKGAGAIAPGGIILNTVRGRAAPRTSIVSGLGPTLAYGNPALNPLTTLTPESGSVKDYVSGLLGRGVGRIRGTVKVKGTPANAPVFRRVLLVREKDGLVLREQWSDKTTGVYDFKFIDELQTWTVISYDHTHDKRAVIADNLTVLNEGVEIMP